MINIGSNNDFSVLGNENIYEDVINIVNDLTQYECCCSTWLQLTGA